MPTAPGAPPPTLAEYLRAWRARMAKATGGKFTQAQAATALGVTRRAVERWEDDEPCRWPRLVVLACERLAKP